VCERSILHIGAWEPLEGHILARKTDEAIEELAHSLRKAVGLEHQARPDMMTVIHKIKTGFKRFGYLRVDDSKLPDAEAQWDADEGVMRLRESVFCAMQRGEVRARYTVAHEIGHFALKHAGVRNRSTHATAAERYVERVRSEESEASRFAAAFLAPAYLIGDGESADSIAERFGLSTQAAVIRHDEVERMRRRASRRGRELPGVVIDYLREAQRRGVPLLTKIDD
jgi:Zn-dependent peptidase ImmA (M78 family)